MINILIKIKTASLIVIILTAATIARLYYLNYPDVTGDEYHYINDGYRLRNGDPYISVRYHTFDHPEGSIAHPFFAQIAIAQSMKCLGNSIFAARLPLAIGGVLTVLVIFLLKDIIGKKPTFIAATFMAISPFLVRYSRDAHLDGIFTLFLTGTAVFSWKYLKSNKLFWLLLTGIFCGLALSTKLDGFLALPLALGIVLAGKFQIKSIKKIINKLVFESLAVLAPAIIVWFLLNDPTSYISAIFKPSDPIYNVSPIDHILRLSTLPPFLIKVLYYLLSPVMFALLIWSVIKAISKFDKNYKVLWVWMLFLTPLFIVHAPGVSGEYGWMPIIVPLLTIIAYTLYLCSKKHLFYIVAFVVLLTAKPLYELGLRQNYLPYYGVDIYNRTINDNHYQQVIDIINKDSPPNSSVYFKAQGNYPMFYLRRDLKWSFSLDEEHYLFVSEGLNRDEMIKHNLKIVYVIHNFQDNKINETYLLSKKL